MRRWLISSAVLLSSFALWLAPQGACAQADGVVVARFSGPRGRVVRRQVVQSIDAAGALRSLEPSDAQRAARRSGGEPSDPEVLAALGARAYVEGRVVRMRRGWAAAIRVLGPDGSEVLSERVNARGFGALTARVARWVDDELLGALAALDVPAAEPTPEPEPEPEPRPASETTTAGPPEADPVADTAPAPSSGAAPIAFTVGASVTHRSLEYNDDLFSTLRPYSLPAAPFLSLGVEYFPGHHTDSEAFRGFSVAASASFAVGVQSVGDNGVVYPTDAWSFGLDARYRLTVDEVTFRIDAGYHATVFSIHDANELSPRPAIPNVETHSLRVGGGLRWTFGPGLFFEGYAAYLHPFEVGEIGSEAWFPRATAGGIDVEGGLGVVVDDVELAGLFTMRRFFYDMHSEPGDQRVAGGAVDEYLSGLVRVTYRPSGL